MKLLHGYELVCGLEVHVELKTATKIFCSCPTTFGAEPNTLCCPVCTGLPGSLPTLNKHVIELAATAGLALGSKISRYTRLDRKNYFYPDLPKAYQISQLDFPLCIGGGITISSGKTIHLTRIHIEEDAGKLIHEGERTLIDCNRCGVPLIEIVTEPDISSPDEATEFLRELRSILVYAGVSDCKMNEGQLRCDVNLSIRKPGDELGVRTEIKNLNSFAFAAKAIEAEYRRQVELIESGERVRMQTLRFDPADGLSLLREKEGADDYRFFPEPDIPPIVLTDELIDRLKSHLPSLPSERRARYISDYGITDRDARRLTEERSYSDKFDSCAALTRYPKLLANLMLGELLTLSGGVNLPIADANLAKLCDLAGDGQINSSTAKRLAKLLFEDDCDPEILVDRLDLRLIRDRVLIASHVKSVLESDTKTVESIRAGKKTAVGALIGKVMSLTGGRADPVIVSELVDEELSKL